MGDFIFVGLNKTSTLLGFNLDFLQHSWYT